MARSMRSGATKRPGVREIAQALGVSIGTVDRALHDRPGINPATRTQVLATAKAMGYRPNLAARFLSSGKRLRIAVNVPRELASFWIADTAPAIVEGFYLGQEGGTALAEVLFGDINPAASCRSPSPGTSDNFPSTTDASPRRFARTSTSRASPCLLSGTVSATPRSSSRT